MEAQVTAILTDERGWQKPFPLTEGVFWLGSAQKAHIQLTDAKGIAPFHLQIVNMLSEASVRLINLSNWALLLQKGEETSLCPAGGMMDIFGPEIIRLGNYTLTFQLNKQNLPHPATKTTKQKVIGINLNLPDVVLRPNASLVGLLTLQNTGDEACQFRVELDGLPEDCYEIAPPPLLFAGGEESTQIRFIHKGTAPTAGQHIITLRVTSPEVYPGQEATLRQTLRVVPVYAHDLSIAVPQPEEKIEEVENEEDQSSEVSTFTSPPSIDPLPEPEVEPQPSEAARPDQSDALTHPSGIMPAAPLDENEMVSVNEASPQPEPQSEEEEGQSLPLNAPVRRPKRPDLSGAKALKATSGDFLDKRNTPE